MKRGYQPIPTAAAVATSSGDQKISKEQEDGWTKGTVQPPAYRDVGFAIVFWLHILVLIVSGILFATGTIPTVPMEDWNMGMNGVTRHLKQKKAAATADLEVPWKLLWIFLGFLLIAPTLSVLSFDWLRQQAQQVIQLSMYLAVAMNVFLALLCLLSGLWWASLGPLLLAGLTMWYAQVIWHRISFAAANLKVAVTSIQSQLGVVLLGIYALPLYGLYLGWWAGVYAMTLQTPLLQNQLTTEYYGNCNGKNGMDADDCIVQTEYSGFWWFVNFLFWLSLFWTFQVIQNTLQATVAGSVGTWWFVPQEASDGCCSSALRSSLFRSLTYSFGSICFGSLIVPVIQALRAIVKNMVDNQERQNDGGAALLACLADCILNLLEQLAEYFNRWAFVYVGLYGYPYLEAGKNVWTLFQNRGWTAIISEDLTSRALGFMTFAIGLVTGLLMLLLMVILPSSDDEEKLAVALAFVLALVFGMMLASIILQVLNSCVETIIVLFAEAPSEFQQVHTDLSNEMNAAWSQAWPDVFSAVASATYNV